MEVAAGKVPAGIIGEYETSSAQETIALGKKLGSMLEPPLLVLLRGDLGTGKTTLTKGLVLGLGVKDEAEVSSPSFTLINEYFGRCKIYHVDLYRLETVRDLESIGLEDALRDRAVVIVEWGEKLEQLEEADLIVDIVDLGDDRRKLIVLAPESRSVQAKRRPKRGKRKNYS